MNNNKLNLKGNKSSRESETSSTVNGQQSTGRNYEGAFIEKGDHGKDRRNISRQNQLNSKIQSKSFSQRIITNNKPCPENLSELFLACETYEELKKLYNEEKDKEFFNYIHATVCFSQSVNLYTKVGGNKCIAEKQLGVFIDKVFSYSKSLDSRSYENLSYDAVKLLDYAENKKFQGTEETEKLACKTLSKIFQAVVSKKNLQDFDSKALVNLANDATQFLDYAQKKDRKGIEETLIWVANETLFNIFDESSSRDFLNFKPNELTNLAYDAMKHTEGWNKMTSQLLIKISKSVNERNFNTFSIQEICKLAWSFSVKQQFSLIYDWILGGLSNLSELQLSELDMENAQHLYVAFLRKAIDDKKWDKEDPDAFLGTYLNKNLMQKILQGVNEEVAKKELRSFELKESIGNELKRVLPIGYTLKEDFYVKPYAVDFAVFKDMSNGKNEELIALISVNDPIHFMCCGFYTSMHKFKEIFLNDMGYENIINIEYDVWRRSKNQENLMKQKLSNVFESHNKHEILVI